MLKLQRDFRQIRERGGGVQVVEIALDVTTAVYNCGLLHNSGPGRRFWALRIC